MAGICVAAYAGSTSAGGAQLKDNDLQLHFEDTNHSVFFPDNDWSLAAKDSNIGIKRSDSVVDLYSLQGNVPTERLAQDGAGGFTPQTWSDGSSGFTPITWFFASK